MTLSAVLLGTAPANAAPQEEPGPATGSVKITPSKVHAGGQINIRVDSCDGDKGIARSDAFISSVALKSAADETLTGDASIRAAIDPGRYTVLVDCYDKTGNLKRSIAEGRFVVIPGGGGESHHPPVRPTAPVKAGGGGTAGSGGSGDSTTLPLTLAGAAALGLAGAAVLRRRAAARPGSHS
ncbi:hypothetical protein MTQ01_21310 [Streptomyces sp. XM4193]|uniref:hypothetical protein n=1 Tax=Streptomyces sp. XM4193 TaxID=2929782 RepID=UPI001FFB7F63|nr:hypothetical protein [Streptomyces sp. XM4193]MCK1798519.1 hypothetical protein [Streptomyces sp. XM4193]